MSIIEEQCTTIDVPTAPNEEGERREVLLKAAEVIEQYGWTNGSLWKSDSFCLIGAIAWASLGPDRFSMLHARNPGALYDEAERVTGDSPDRMYEWNDAWDHAGRRVRDKKEVLRVLRAMANGKTFEEAIK